MKKYFVLMLACAQVSMSQAHIYVQINTSSGETIYYDCPNISDDKHDSRGMIYEGCTQVQSLPDLDPGTAHMTTYTDKVYIGGHGYHNCSNSYQTKAKVSSDGPPIYTVDIYDKCDKQ